MNFHSVLSNLSGLTIQKKECSDKYCSSCNSPGCLNGGQTHEITINCTYNYSDWSISDTFSVQVTEANPPTFQYAGKWYLKKIVVIAKQYLKNMQFAFFFLLLHTLKYIMLSADNKNFIEVFHDNATVGDVISRLNVSDLEDNNNDVDQASYWQNSGPQASYEKNTPDLFKLDTGMI